MQRYDLLPAVRPLARVTLARRTCRAGNRFYHYLRNHMWRTSMFGHILLIALATIICAPTLPAQTAGSVVIVSSNYTCHSTNRYVIVRGNTAPVTITLPHITSYAQEISILVTSGLYAVTVVGNDATDSIIDLGGASYMGGNCPRGEELTLFSDGPMDPLTSFWYVHSSTNHHCDNWLSRDIPITDVPVAPGSAPHQTLRWTGTAWVPSGFMMNNDVDPTNKTLSLYGTVNATPPEDTGSALWDLNVRGDALVQGLMKVGPSSLVFDGLSQTIGTTAGNLNVSPATARSNFTGTVATDGAPGLVLGNLTQPSIAVTDALGLTVTDGTNTLFTVSDNGSAGTASANLMNAGTGFRVANAAALGTYLRGNGTNFVGSSLNLGDAAAGVLAVSHGGTGQSALTSGSVLLGNGTSAATLLAGSNDGDVLTWSTSSSSWTSGTPATGTSGVNYNVSSAQNTATPANYLFNVAYPDTGSAATYAGAVVSADGSVSTAGDVTATGLDVSAAGKGDGVATALKLTASGGADNFELWLKGTGTGASTFTAGAQGTMDIHYVLPTTAPNVGDVLMATAVSRSNVTLAWSPVPAGTTTSRTFSGAGTYYFNVPTGVYALTIEAVGGGGAGGTSASDASGNGHTGGAGGGGSGEYAANVVSVTPGELVRINVGAGGTHVHRDKDPNVDGPDGNPGTASTVVYNHVTVVTAHGGSGGHGSPVASVGGGGWGGAGGTGSTDRYHINGKSGIGGSSSSGADTGGAGGSGPSLSGPNIGGDGGNGENNGDGHDGQDGGDGVVVISYRLL